MCAVVLGKIKPGSRASQTPPTKGISLVATPIDVRSGSFGARLGAGLWLKGLRTGPNRPTGPPTTSNCSRMSCSHHHHAEVLAQGLASLSTLHVSLKPKRKKASHNRCSTIARGSGAFDTVWPSAKNLVPPGHGSLKKQGRECVQLSLVRSNLPGSGAIQTPPTKGISLVATPIDVRSGSFGARLGGWFVAQRAPNRPKSTLQPPIAAA